MVFLLYRVGFFLLMCMLSGAAAVQSSVKSDAELCSTILVHYCQTLEIKDFFHTEECSQYPIPISPFEYATYKARYLYTAPDKSLLQVESFSIVGLCNINGRANIVLNLNYKMPRSQIISALEMTPSAQGCKPLSCEAAKVFPYHFQSAVVERNELKMDRRAPA